MNTLLEEEEPPTITIATRQVVQQASNDDASASHSEYSDSDDDSAELFADDEDASQLLKNDLQDDEQDDAWLAEDIYQSSKLIYNIMALLVVSSFVVTFVTLHFSRSQSSEEYRIVVSTIILFLINIPETVSPHTCCLCLKHIPV